MDPKYKDVFGVTEKDIRENGLLVVKSKVEPVDLLRAIQVCDHYPENPDQYQSISFILRIKDKNGSYRPFFTTSKLIDVGLVSCSIQIDKVLFPNKTMEQILNETAFIRSNIQRFARERQILQKVAQVLSWKQISMDFGASDETIKTYKKWVCSKLEN